MGRAIKQYRENQELRRLHIIAGGSDEDVTPLSVTTNGPFQTCTLNGDVTGNNFHGNYACFDLGIQFGNPAQGAGLTVAGQSNHGGLQLFAGFGPPPPLSYDRQGLGTAPAAQPLGGIGAMYMQVDSGSIWWFSGSTWVQKVV